MTYLEFIEPGLQCSIVSDVLLVRESSHNLLVGHSPS